MTQQQAVFEEIIHSYYQTDVSVSNVEKVALVLSQLCATLG